MYPATERKHNKNYSYDRKGMENSISYELDMNIDEVSIRKKEIRNNSK